MLVTGDRVHVHYVKTYLLQEGTVVVIRLLREKIMLSLNYEGMLTKHELV